MIIKQCAIIILAAGSSTRLGRPKQLLQYNHQSLLQHAVSAALESKAGPVIVVLGGISDISLNELEGKSVDGVINVEWNEGIASSIRWGLNFLQKKYPVVDAALFMVCDQPFVTAALLNEITATQKNTGKPIAASRYGDTIGVPALFHKSLFTELQQLKGDTGARKIIQQNLHLTTTVAFPQGNIDIDTAGDYSNLLNNSF